MHYICTRCQVMTYHKLLWSDTLEGQLKCAIFASVQCRAFCCYDVANKFKYNIIHWEIPLLASHTAALPLSSTLIV